MKKLYVLIALFFVPFLHGCEEKDPLNKPKTDTRTMIIGGVPADDRDFSLNARDHLPHPKILDNE